MIGIVVALSEELKVLLSLMDDMEQSEIQNTMFFTGHLNGRAVVVVQSQVGKVNAAISTMLLLSRFAVSAVINIGSAGGLGCNINTLDVVISERTKQYDTNFEFKGQPSFFEADSKLLAYSEKVGDQLQDIKIQRGFIISGDLFVSTEVSEKITEKYPMALCCDMETAAVANVCWRMEIPFLGIRGVSDVPAAENNKIVFDQNVVQAANNCVRVMLAVFAQMDQVHEEFPNKE